MSHHQEDAVLNASPLAERETRYVNTYDPSQLYPIERALNWAKRGIDRVQLPFTGVDIWNCYEASWLNAKGRPVVRLIEFRVPADSTSIIESKSFKLYLNSFNLSRFNSDEQVRELMVKDLSAASGAPVEVVIRHPDQAAEVGNFDGECIDELDVEIEHYHPQPELLTATDEIVEQSLYSHLLKSNCPVTGQPDWGSLQIRYTGPKLDQEGLLKYIISYREHGDFHEQCVENIFMDIWQRCKPERLEVYARYVRRGGLDINPYRSSEPLQPDNQRLSRQ